MSLDTVLEEIARKHLFIGSLTVRNSDRLDVYEVTLPSLKDALQAAYDAGKQSCKATK